MSTWDTPENPPPAANSHSESHANGTFDTGAMQAAIVDADASNSAAQAGRVDPENSRRARELGWVEPQSFDYGARAPTTVLHAEEPVDEENGDEMVSRHQSSTWAHDAAKYEWDAEYGDVGPRNEKLEAELFRADFHNRAGEKFKNLITVKVIVESKTRVEPIQDFKSAGLHPVMLENVELCGYEFATPIQAYAIPAVITGHDMIGVAQTGSGKTAAFLVPCISQLMGKVKKLAAPRPNLAVGFDPARDRVRAEPLILVVAPTRELCCQIFDEARRLCYRSMMRPCVAYGGAPIRDQVAQLARGCDLLVATPGRLLDYMSRPDILSLSRVRYTIIDEADQMLHSDWEEDMAKIMGGGDANEDGDHRYLLFSATFPKRLQRLAAKFLDTDHIHVSIGRTGSTHANVKQQVLWADQDKKMRALYDLLISMPPSRTLVFVRFKKTADFVDDYLFNLGLPSTSIHSDRTQIEREDAIRSFKAGQSPILVATGVSARGLDIRNVMHVINFDLPSAEHDGQNEYIHRIGRTARIGNEGLATSFYNERDEPMGEFLTKILMETNQEVPDFLQHFKPEDGVLNFDEDDEEEDQDTMTTDGGASGGAWGSGGDSGNAGNVGGADADNTAADSWGTGGDDGASGNRGGW
ncbi:hypothetical protein PV08_06103 [Exophiala spinifera]|uniref:RNA helicase n=1 Tax=Exophiala spinifera TaxID=91928 RepID=A0A0D1ZTG2_9EURO|nr:uncharacterized protein PV08_06103 [Exophiala spinifera]KIW16052.1 hypothetical protein PV08_06103 [Exophiala spinifera]